MEKGVKIRLINDFGVIRETLSRMGIINKREKIITPSCYIFRDNDEYFICHFKELLTLVEDTSDELDKKDTDRRNSICTLLENWGLIEVIDTNVYQETLIEKIIILSYSDKEDYEFNHKFKSFRELTELLSNQER